VDYIITEGVKKGLAADQHGYPTAVLPGVWNWQQKREKGEDGQGLGVRKLVNDLKEIAWKGRRVNIIFDSDAAHNHLVQEAEWHLARALMKRGAVVHVVRLPGEIDADGMPAKLGLDDYLLDYGPEGLRNLLVASKPEKPPARPPSVTNALVELVLEECGGELFHDVNKVPYAVINVNGRRETLAIRSDTFKTWLTYRAHSLGGEVPGEKAVNDAVRALTGKAILEGPERQVHLRVARREGKVYLNLGDAEGRSVEIGPDGWEVVTEPPVCFLRTGTMRPLPAPEPGGNLGQLREFLNMKEDRNWKMLVALILSLLKPEGPYPVAIVCGEEGSAKTTACETVRAVVDDNDPPHASLSSKEEDIVVNGLWNRVVCFDNVSRISPSTSDVLCRMATGAGFAKRKLYTDDEAHFISLSRPVIVNGIEREMVSRSDLANRAIFIELEPLPSGARKSKAALAQAWEGIRPAVLGALCDLVSVGLRNEGNPPPRELPRMADFAAWVEACAPGLGWEPGAFIEAFEEMQGEADVVALSHWPASTLLFHYLQEHGGYSGGVQNLFNKLVALANVKRMYDSAPKSPRALGGALRRLARSLRRYGVTITFLKRSKRGCGVEIVWDKTKALPLDEEQEEPARLGVVSRPA
jgi:hypothetical protein